MGATIVNEEAEVAEVLGHEEVAHQLGHPPRIRVSGGATDVDPSGVKLDREQHGERARERALHGGRILCGRILAGGCSARARERRPEG